MSQTDRLIFSTPPQMKGNNLKVNLQNRLALQEYMTDANGEERGKKKQFLALMQA